jgi:prolyl oligopeptidase
MIKTRPSLVFLLVMSLILMALSANAQKLAYPKTAKVDHTDTYFGTKVADPYRWLEDDNSPETARWVEAENRVTFDYLNKIPFRAALKARLEQLYNYPKYTSPFHRGDLYFFSKNNGLQNQSVLYMQHGLNGAPEVLIDPNVLSPDGTTRLLIFTVSKDAKYAAYGLSKAGSDWEDFYVMDLATKKTLPETLHWVKVSGIAWQGDGFYYSRYPEPDQAHALSTKNENHQVFYHKVGTPQSADVLVYEDHANPQRFHHASTTEDERFVILSIADRGKGKDGNALFYRKKEDKDFKPIVSEIGDYSFDVVDNVGDKLLIRTNKNAPNWKIVLFDPAHPEEQNWKEIIAEKPEPIESADIAGGKLFVTYLKDVSTRAYVFSLDGKMKNEIKLPGLGAATGFRGERNDKFVFYTFTSFNYAPTIYRYDIATRASSVFRAPEIAGFNPEDYETRQVFYTSKDGTRVPMFIVYKKGLQLNGENPTLLYAYGGFNINTSPAFSALRLAWLEQGGVYASANLRGGGEYGEKWHQAGMRLNKQKVFDDFIAAAEYLIKEKYTSPQRLAIQGASNGGLLIGAVINQRPDLFRVAIPQVGVMDMLRFHKFTIGWNWIAEYGSSEASEADFKNLYAYSPLHNIKAQPYPATLITTADHDDRVVPAHSFKYAATLQEMNTSDNPILIRIETKSGHGASSTAKQIEATADIYAFILYNMGITPKY